MSGMVKASKSKIAEDASEVEVCIVGILTHPKATDAIKTATKLLVQEYENISAMENRLRLIGQSEDSKLSVQENLAHKNVQKKIRAMENRFMQMLLWLQEEDVKKLEAVCADVLLKHSAVKKAQAKVSMPKGH